MLSPSLKLRHERPKAAPLLRSTSAAGENAARKPSGCSRTSAPAVIPRAAIWAASTPLRSEEHTSELQSLMRISYAVFCLNKNKQHTYTETPYQPTTQPKAATTDSTKNK